MASVTVTRFFRAPVEKSFAVATDLRRAPERIPGILKLEVLNEGPIRVGTRFRETRRMFGKEATEEMEITAMQPPHSYTVCADSHGCRYRSEFRFAPKDGGTEVTMEFRAEPYSFFAKVMSVLMRPMMKQVAKLCAADLDALAAHVEKA